MEEEALLVVDGQTYSQEQVERMVRLLNKLQLNTLESILQELRPDLKPVERFRNYEMVEEIAPGWRLIAEQPMITLSFIFGLEMSWVVLQECVDAGAFRQRLSEAMQKVGDRFWGLWQERYGTRGS